MGFVLAVLYFLGNYKYPKRFIWAFEGSIETYLTNFCEVELGD